MAWTAPRTWVTNEMVTAALMNTHVRDNLLETSTPTVTTAGDIPYADAANSMGSRLAIGAAGSRLISTGSAPVWRANAASTNGNTYTAGGAFPLAFTALNSALWGSGTNVTITLTTGTQCLIGFGCRFAQHPTLGSNVQLSVAVSGATTLAASNTWGTAGESDPAGTLINHGRVHLFTGLTAGSNTFTLQGLVSTGAAATIQAPWLIGQAL